MISKSDYLLWKKHPCWLWLKKNSPDILPPPDAGAQERMRVGADIEEIASKRWTDIQRGTVPDRAGAVGLQCTLEHDGFQCRCDALKRLDDGALEVIEIKSSTRAKPEHHLDLAFQCQVALGSGHKVSKLTVLHIDQGYVRTGQIDPESLLLETDVTEEVYELLSKVLEEMVEARRCAALDEMPDTSPRHCGTHDNDIKNQWLTILRHAFEWPEQSVYEIPRMKLGASAELEDEEILRFADVPDDRLTPAQRSKKRLLTIKEPEIKRNKIKEELGQLTFPICFLDYETSSVAVPDFEGTKPYQQVVFQHSVHVLEKLGVEPKHHEYLHVQPTLPARKVAESLEQALSGGGSIIVWNKGFEMSRNREMAELLPEYAEFFESINDRIYDLMVPFKDGALYADARFVASASIKRVLPVIVPDLSYGNLDIQEGESAARLWREAVLKGSDEIDPAKVLQDLRDYCRLDTLAMVRIYQHLASL